MNDHFIAFPSTLKGVCLFNKRKITYGSLKQEFYYTALRYKIEINKSIF